MKLEKQGLKIEYVSVDELKAYEGNSRTHSAKQVEQVAASIQEFGFVNPVLVGDDGVIIAGHGRLMAAKRVGMTEVPAIRLGHLSDAQRRALVIADNQIATNAGWDEDALAKELMRLDDDGFNLALVGFDERDLAALLEQGVEQLSDLVDEDEVPSVDDSHVVTRVGDVWQMGGHRVMCGDSTQPHDIEMLMAGQQAALLHADPPYGMGKEKDGVENDNLRREKLDAFQMTWWEAFRPHLDDRGSAYVWGNPEDLWRLWFVGGLKDSEYLELRNQIIWDKKCIAGMKSDLIKKFPVTSEHCLFFQFGWQFFGSVNSDQYYEGWEPLRSYLKEQADKSELTPKKLMELCGVHMYAHWFSKSQWVFIPRKHYETLQQAFPGCFERQYTDIRGEYEQIKVMQQEIRSYFDNTHDVMRDVWEFPRVTGDERHGHATPKPVAMMARVMYSSLPRDGLCAEPFGGSGSTLIGAEKTGRRCYTMELTPFYVDVIVKRWQDYTGKDAVLEGDGRTFNEIAGSMEDAA